jgi:hypothetical protein
MFELSNLPASTAAVLGSVALLVCGYPLWALAYVILGLGIYVGLQLLQMQASFGGE